MPAKGQTNPSIRDGRGNLIPWKKRNKSASNAVERARRAANPEKIRTQNRKYRESNPFGVAVTVARQRAEEFGVVSTLTTEEWKEVVKIHEYICHVCGERVSLEINSPLRISLDHVVPLSRGGDNTKENVLPAHRRCNQSRNDMTLEEFNDWISKVQSWRNSHGKG